MKLDHEPIDTKKDMLLEPIDTKKDMLLEPIDIKKDKPLPEAIRDTRERIERI